MSKLSVQIRVLCHAKDLPLPRYGTPHSVGVDLCAAVEESLELSPGHRVLVPTGLQIALPSGFEAQVRSRSGLALNHGLMVLNSPGTIDPDYRGEIKVILLNLGQEPFLLERGMRIAQLVVAPFVQVRWNPVETWMEDTQRQEKGFGSTGLHVMQGSRT